MEQTKVSECQRAMKTALRIMALVTLITIFAGCAFLDRRQPSDSRSYSLSASPSAHREILKRREKMIEGRGEREDYYKAKPHLRSDGERLEYLSLSSPEARERYLKSRGVDGDQITHPFDMQTLIDENDVAAGMTKQAVKEAWGPPDDVEVAGNPIYGNERWKYSEQVTSSEGYMTEKRTVIFEAGRVVGWETRK